MRRQHRRLRYGQYLLINLVTTSYQTMRNI